MSRHSSDKFLKFEKLGFVPDMRVPSTNKKGAHQRRIRHIPVAVPLSHSRTTCYMFSGLLCSPFHRHNQPRSCTSSNKTWANTEGVLRQTPDSSLCVGMSNMSFNILRSFYFPPHSIVNQLDLPKETAKNTQRKT